MTFDITDAKTKCELIKARITVLKEEAMTEAYRRQKEINDLVSVDAVIQSIMQEKTMNPVYDREYSQNEKDEIFKIQSTKLEKLLKK